MKKVVSCKLRTRTPERVWEKNFHCAHINFFLSVFLACSRTFKWWLLGLWSSNSASIDSLMLSPTQLNVVRSLKSIQWNFSILLNPNTIKNVCGVNSQNSFERYQKRKLFNFVNTRWGHDQSLLYVNTKKFLSRVFHLLVSYQYHPSLFLKLSSLLLPAYAKVCLQSFFSFFYYLIKSDRKVLNYSMRILQIIYSIYNLLSWRSF